MAEVLFTIPLRDSSGKLVNFDFTSDDIGVNEQSSPMTFSRVGVDFPAANFSTDDTYDVYINGEKVCYLWTLVPSNTRYGVFSTSPTPTQDLSTQYIYQGEIVYQFGSSISEEDSFVYLDVRRINGQSSSPLITGSTKEEVIQSVVAFFQANKLSFKLIGEDEITSCLNGEGLYIVPTRTVKPKEYWGLSTSTKPTTAENLSIYHEVDTGDDYYFSNGTWTKVGSSPDETLFTIQLLDENNQIQDVEVKSSMVNDEGESVGFMITGYNLDTAWPYSLLFEDSHSGQAVRYSSDPLRLPDLSGQDSGVLIYYAQNEFVLVVPQFVGQPDPTTDRAAFFEFLKNLQLRIITVQS